jgi:hypothetical protein
MSETKPIPDTAETPKRADAIADSTRDWGIAPLLRARAELLSGPKPP